MTETNCLDKLRDRLGDLSKYSNTCWKCIVTFDENKLSYEWEQTHKFKISLTTPPKIKDINMFCDSFGQCYCETGIMNHHLIQHINSKKFYFIGSSCINHFKEDGGTGLKRVCINCNMPNRCKSLRCKNCRILCVMHNEFHDNNLVCYRCIFCSDISHTSLFKYMCFTCTKDDLKLKMGNSPSFKSKYLTVWKCFNDNDYMNWLCNQRWFKYKNEWNLYQTYMGIKQIKDSMASIN